MVGEWRVGSRLLPHVGISSRREQHAVRVVGDAVVVVVELDEAANGLMMMWSGPENMRPNDLRS